MKKNGNKEHKDPCRDRKGEIVSVTVLLMKMVNQRQKKLTDGRVKEDGQLKVDGHRLKVELLGIFLLDPKVLLCWMIHRTRLQLNKLWSQSQVQLLTEIEIRFPSNSRSTTSLSPSKPFPSSTLNY